MNPYTPMQPYAYAHANMPNACMHMTYHYVPMELLGLMDFFSC